MTMRGEAHVSWVEVDDVEVGEKSGSDQSPVEPSKVLCGATSQLVHH